MSSRFVLIAQREYTIRGTGTKVVVMLGGPKKSLESADFFCEYTVAAFNEDRVRRIFGVNAFQALNLTLKAIDSELRRLSVGWDLEWAGGKMPELPFPE